MSNATRKYRYDYFRVSVPSDCAPSVEDLGQIAIQEAQERAKLYCIPALWTAQAISGGLDCLETVFRVCRKRNNANR